jgi:integrase
VAHLAEWAGGPLRLVDLTEQALAEFAAAQSAIVSPATVNGKLRCLTTLWRFGWRRRWLVDLPREVPHYREPCRLPTAWTETDVARLVAAARALGPWWESLVLVAYYTAARIGALLAVEWHDVDLSRGWLVLRAEASKVLADELKGLPPSAVDALTRLGPRGGSERVWPWGEHRNTFFRRLRSLIEGAGLPCPHGHCELAHRLRRSRLTHLAARESLEAARALAGHSDARVTRAHYLDPRHLMRRAADTLPTL